MTSHHFEWDGTPFIEDGYIFAGQLTCTRCGRVVYCESLWDKITVETQDHIPEECDFLVVCRVIGE